MISDARREVLTKGTGGHVVAGSKGFRTHVGSRVAPLRTPALRDAPAPPRPPPPPTGASVEGAETQPPTGRAASQ
eukprot:3913706-Rhodomonas_salina.1